jgi:hypothetical protein
MAIKSEWDSVSKDAITFAFRRRQKETIATNKLEA